MKHFTKSRNIKFLSRCNMKHFTKLRKLFFILFVFLFSFSFSFGIDYTSCGQGFTSGNSYVMTGNISNGGGSGTCVNIGANSDISFDCAGFEIYNGVTSGYGISISSGANNISFSNCDIVGFSRAVSISSTFNSMDFINITNLVVSNSSRSMFVDVGENLTNFFVNNFTSINDIYSIRFEGNGFIKDSFFNNLYFPKSGSLFEKIYITSDPIFENLTINNSYIFDVDSDFKLFNSQILNSQFYALNVNSTNGFMSNISVDVENLLFAGPPLFILNGTLNLNGKNNVIENSLLDRVTVYESNNTFIGNEFTNLSWITVSDSPNIFSNNIYYNVTGGASSVCFFGGLVCDSSAIVLAFGGGGVPVESSDSSISIANLPSFGFWSSVVSVVFVLLALVL